MDAGNGIQLVNTGVSLLGQGCTYLMVAPVMDCIVNCHQNSHAEVQTSDMTVYGDRAFKEVVKVK